MPPMVIVMNKMLVLAGALLLTNVSLAAQADFSGVWKVTQYHPQLRTVDGKEPPLLPEAAVRHAKNLSALRNGDTRFDLTARQCASPGTPRVLFLPYPFEIIQTPQQVTFLFEWNHLFRMAPMGKAREYSYSTAMGASMAEWEGETLVVKTDTLSDNTLLDASGLPHTEQLKVTERYALSKGGKHMMVHILFEDPDVYSEPWGTVVEFERLSGYKIKEDVCLDRQARGEPIIRP